MIGEWEKIDKKDYYAGRRWRSFRAAGLSNQQRRKSDVHKTVPTRLQAIFIDTRFRLENILRLYHVYGKRYGLFQIGPGEEIGNFIVVQKGSEYNQHEHFKIGKREVGNQGIEGKIFSE